MDVEQIGEDRDGQKRRERSVATMVVRARLPADHRKQASHPTGGAAQPASEDGTGRDSTPCHAMRVWMHHDEGTASVMQIDVDRGTVY